ncbi:MAG: hypothetical protein ACK4H7_04160, partial [Acidilobaceae archaeon]
MGVWRGQLSGPVLAILVTLILVSIGAAIIAYTLLFRGIEGPVLAVKAPPIACSVGNSAQVE